LFFGPGLSSLAFSVGLFRYGIPRGDLGRGTESLLSIVEWIGRVSFLIAVAIALTNVGRGKKASVRDGLGNERQASRRDGGSEGATSREDP
jgi:hypothetical protein